jgi:hypothetical protein
MLIGMIRAASVTLADIGIGWHGTAQTIAAMQELVSGIEGKRHVAIHEAARQLAQACPGSKNYLCQAKMIFGFVAGRIKFVRDPYGIETVQSPIRTLQYAAGDCDDFSILFNALTESAGLRTWFKTIKGDPSAPDEFSHVYAVVEIPGIGQVPADCTQAGAELGWEPQGYPAQLWPGSVEGR